MPDPLRAEKRGRWAYVLPDSGGALRKLVNTHYLWEAHSLLVELVGEVTYYVSRDGKWRAHTDLRMAPGNERAEWDEAVYPRYLDTFNFADVSVRGVTFLQTAPGASTFAPGVTVSVSTPQPTVEPRDVVSEPRPPFTEVIGGPGVPSTSGGETANSRVIADPFSRPLPEFQAPRTIAVPETLQAIASSKLKPKAPGALAESTFKVDPVVTPLVIKIIVTAIGALFGGIFGGGVSKEVKRGFDQMRDALLETNRAQTKFTWSTAFGFGWSLIALGKLWVRVVRPLLEAVKNIIDDIRRIYDRVLKPLFTTIEKIRRHILQIYERFVRPVIVAIQRVRKALYILRLLGFKFAEKLDRRLAELESRITGPLLEVLRQVNTMGGWLNVVLTAGGLLQGPTLVNSLAHYADDWIRLFYAGHGSALDALTRSKLYQAPKVKTLDEARAAMRRTIIDQSDERALEIREAEARSRARLGL